jgi:hypothetical protein
VSSITFNIAPRNRRERRARAAIERKLNSLSPAARDLAMQTGMEVQEQLDGLNEQRLRDFFEENCDRIAAEVEEDIRNEQHTFVQQRIKEILSETDVGQRLLERERDVSSLTRLYVETWLGWLASGGSPKSSGCVGSTQCLLLAMEVFRDRMLVLETRVRKRDVECFTHPERLYGALQWLTTVYLESKRGITPCADLDASCRAACGFRYVPHQSEVTRSMFANDYGVRRNGKTVQLREHLTFGSSHDPRHTIRIAMFMEGDKVVVGFVGQHQATRQAN